MSTPGPALVVIVTFLLLPQGFAAPLRHPPPPPLYTLSSKMLPIPRVQYLLLAEKKVTCSIISEWTFDLTFTEEAKNSRRCEDAAGLAGLYIFGWRTDGQHVRIIIVWQHESPYRDEGWQGWVVTHWSECPGRVYCTSHYGILGVVSMLIISVLLEHYGTCTCRKQPTPEAVMAMTNAAFWLWFTLQVSPLCQCSSTSIASH